MKSTMRARITRHRWLVALSATALLLAACGGSEDIDEPAEPTEEEPAAEDDDADDAADDTAAPEDLGTVTVALSVPDSLPFLPAQLGPEQGKFEACDVEVDIILGESSTVGRSLAAGEADLALQAAPRAVGEIMQGIPGKIVAGQKNPWSQVLVVSSDLAEQGITTPEDFAALEGGGYGFGISSFGSAGHLSVLRLAEFLDWEEGPDFEIIPLGGVAEITAGLEAGAIDAFTWSRGVAYRMEAENVGLVIEGIVPEAVGPTIFEAFVASDTFIEERPEALVAYFDCYFDYVNELKADPDEVRRLALEEWDANPQTLDQTMDLIIEEWNPDGTATAAELEGLADGAVFQNDEIDDAPLGDWWLLWEDLR